MDSFGAFLDTQLLRIERLLREETQSERINHQLARQTVEGVEAGDAGDTITPFHAMRQIGVGDGFAGWRRR